MADSNFIDYVKIMCRSGKGGAGSMHFHRAKYVPKTEYNFKNSNGKKIINVILVYPSYKNIILDKGGEERVLHSGDLFFDKVILTPLAFGRILSQSSEN